MIVFLTNLVNDPKLKDLFAHLSIAEHMDEFSKGIVDTRRLVFYLSATLFFLWVASRTLEDKKWR
jgi:ABC-2 type transport system permease protein